MKSCTRIRRYLTSAHGLLHFFGGFSLHHLSFWHWIGMFAEPGCDAPLIGMKLFEMCYWITNISFYSSICTWFACIGWAANMIAQTFGEIFFTKTESESNWRKITNEVCTLRSEVFTAFLTALILKGVPVLLPFCRTGNLTHCFCYNKNYISATCVEFMRISLVEMFKDIIWIYWTIM